MGYSLFVDLTVVTAVRTEFAKEEPDTRIEVRGIPGTDQVALLTAGTRKEIELAAVEASKLPWRPEDHPLRQAIEAWKAAAAGHY